MISIEQILQMPNAALLAEQLKSALEAEQEKRRYFYEIIDEEKKTEFINGEIVFHSPSKLRHTSAVTLLAKLLHTHVVKNQLGYVGTEKMLVSLTRNDYEPDICFFDKSKSQHFTPAQMRFPAPDFVVEVLSDSTAERDRTTKFEDYAAHEVAEYWIIDPERETIEQFYLQNGRYELLLKSNNGEVRSVVLPNFVIPVRAVFDENLNLEVLGKLLAE
jgi:Uma2 family endonuclease